MITMMELHHLATSKCYIKALLGSTLKADKCCYFPFTLEVFKSFDPPLCQMKSIWSWLPGEDSPRTERLPSPSPARRQISSAVCRWDQLLFVWGCTRTGDFHKPASNTAWTQPPQETRFYVSLVQMAMVKVLLWKWTSNQSCFHVGRLYMYYIERVRIRGECCSSSVKKWDQPNQLI